MNSLRNTIKTLGGAAISLLIVALSLVATASPASAASNASPLPSCGQVQFVMTVKLYMTFADVYLVDASGVSKHVYQWKNGNVVDGGDLTFTTSPISVEPGTYTVTWTDTTGVGSDGSGGLSKMHPGPSVTITSCESTTTTAAPTTQAPTTMAAPSTTAAVSTVPEATTTTVAVTTTTASTTTSTISVVTTTIVPTASTEAPTTTLDPIATIPVLNTVIEGTVPEPATTVTAPAEPTSDAATTSTIVALSCALPTVGIQVLEVNGECVVVTTTTQVVTVNSSPMPATGSDPSPILRVAALVLALGIIALVISWVSRRPKIV